MRQAFFLLRFILLAVSLYGSLQFLRKYIRPEFCIGVYFSIVSSVLFLAGILNLLREATWVLFLGGLFLAGLSIKRKMPVTNVLCFGTVFFLAFGVFFLFQLHGSIFTSYDNFSHWALAARILTENDRFPNFKDINLLFTSYPLGSTVLLYYIAEILGNSAEWVLMYAQAMLMVGMLTSLFSFAWNKIQTLVISICAVFLLCGNNSFFELLVDSLLPIVALSAMALCLYYGQELTERIWLIIPYGIFLISIKNSGTLFAVILYGYVFLKLRRSIRPKNWLLLLTTPAATLLLWQKHVSQVFPNGMMGKHSMSLDYFSDVLRRKDFSDNNAVIVAMAHKVFSLSNPVLWALAFGLLLWLVLRRSSTKPCAQVKDPLLLAAASYVLYQIGTLGMYIFSMPRGEALRLASYGRYHQTILLFVAGLLLIAALQALAWMQADSLRKPVQIGTLCAALLLCFLMISPNFSYFQKQQYKNTERYKFDQIIAQYQLPRGANYLILTREDRADSGLLNYMTLYLLNPVKFRVQPDVNLDSIDLSDYHYVIAFEESERITEFMAKLSPDAAPVVCLREPVEEY
ncbi:MAG: hypothetical protein ACI3XG_06020 [Faecousia sp.]